MATRYEFVIQGQNPRSYTKETQTKIRRQAMRAAAQARKAAGNYGKRNVRQQRLVVQSTDEEAAGAAGAELESGQISPPGTLNSASSSTSTSSSPPSGRSNSDSVEPPSSRSSVGSGDGLSSGEDSPPLTGPDPDELLVPLGSSGARKASSASAWSSSASSQYSQYLVPYDASRQRRHALMPSRMPPSGFDMLVVEYGIHPQDLSGLTSIHIGPIASNVLGQGPTKLLPQVMRCRQWSYFDFVASRYGRGHPCLDDALRCIALKTRAVLVPDQRRYNTEALAQYGRSLRSLQRAIDDPKSWVSADVLCATEILSLFELLSFNGPKGWTSHILGAARLIQLRGPQRFKTEFEKALFLSLVGPIVVDALLSNERCFLEGPEWQQLLVSTTDTDSGPLSDTSPISIELFAHLTRIPGFFRRVSDAVWLGDLTPSDELEALVKDLRQERKAVLAWRQEFDCLIVGNNDARFPSSFSYGTYRGARMSAAEEDKRYELLGTGLVVGLFVSRLLSAVCPAGNERSILEDECLSMSREVVRLECVLDDDGDDSTNRRAGLHLNQKAHIAKATLDTAAIWDAPDEDLVVDVDVKTESGPKQVAYGSARTIAKWKFEAWCNAITRKAFAVAELEKRAAKLAGKG